MHAVSVRFALFSILDVKCVSSIETVSRGTYDLHREHFYISLKLELEIDRMLLKIHPYKRSEKAPCA